jgi:2,4-dienoyl-CoA reductase-like NADH-dependent reductase (Old Yellow Enzyme family)/thioredoxin reductase
VTDTASPVRYPNVFSPLRIGPLEVPNRIYLSPHGLPLEAPVPGHETHHLPSSDHAHYFAERAAGGVGLIFHSAQVGPFAAQTNLSASPGLKASIPSYRRVAEMVHEHGARIMAELWYVAWYPKRWDALGPDAPTMAPSSTQQYTMPGTRYAMRTRDIQNVLAAHRDAARNLRAAGYDGVELHVSHGSLLEYFLSPYHNHRTDDYGGALENRARFLREALEVTREEIGSEMALGIRLTADQLLPGGYDEQGARDVLSHLVPLGLLDFVDLDISVEPEQAHLMSTSYFMPKLHNAERVTSVAPAAKPLPVLATPGRVTNLAEAERLIAAGTAEMIGIVRGLIAEPEMVRHAQEGREGESRVCIAANHCTGNVMSMGTFGCAINPAAGREENWGTRVVRPAATQMSVLVIGGGPAGLEAARTASLGGHSVTLVERTSALGGGVALWAQIPGREHVGTLPKWFARQLERNGVEVRLGVAGDRALVRELSPDVVFVATGSHYAQTGASGFAPQPVPGWERDFVHQPEAVIRGDIALGGNVVVLDEEGYNTAVGVAEIAALHGARVELVTRKLTIAEGLAREARYVDTRLRAAGVVIATSSYLREIGDGTVTLEDLVTGEHRTTPVDSVVLATMRLPDDELADVLTDEVEYVYLIGDALAPRSLRDATYEGHRFARVIGGPAMPKWVTDELFAPLNTLRPAADA